MPGALAICGIPIDSSAPQRVQFALRNPGLVPRKVTLISYPPGETKNGTAGFWLGPYAERSFSFPIGTRLYLASAEQVERVMAGRKIRREPPFRIVGAADNGTRLDIE